MKPGIRLFLLLLAGILLLSLPGPEYVRAEPAGGNEDPAYTEPDKEQEANELKQEIMSELDLKEVQDMLDAMLGEESFSFREALENLLTGKDAFSEEAVQKILHGLLFSGLEKEKSLFMKILLLILLAALLANFASVFDSGQIGEISFYIVYLLLFMLLMNSFSQAASALQQVISWMTDFMKALAPAYLITVSAASAPAPRRCSMKAF